MNERKPRVNHGIATATYASDGHTYRPVMECMCGWGTGWCDSWEEAGVKLDEHLERAVKP